MSTSENLNRPADCWKDSDYGRPTTTWPIIPDLSVIKDLAIQNLPPSFADTGVEFFAEGSFNKIYNIRSSHFSRQYLMRVSLPVEPFYKTESECATLAYIEAYTTIPVPKYVAHDSSSNNPL